MEHVPTTSKNVDVKIRQRNGRYQVRWRAEGVQRGKTFDTLSRAVQFREQLGDPAPGGPSRGESTISVGQLFSEWLPTRSHLAPSTAQRDLDFIRRYIGPYFTHQSVSNVTNHDIGQWVIALRVDGGTRTAQGGGRRALAPGTVFKALQLFRQALDHAVHQGLVERNVTAGIKVPGHTKPRLAPPPLAHEKIALVLDALSGRGPEHAALAHLMADTGLRIGEALALDVRHLDTEDGQRSVTVEQSWSQSEDRLHFEIGGVKTDHAHRVVPTLRPATVALLAKLTGDKPHDAPLFVGSHGSRLRPDNYRNRVFNPTVHKIDERLTPHSLRHYAISSWLSDGVKPLTVMEWAGHANLQMIQTTYAHYIDVGVNEKRCALEDLEAKRVKRDAQLSPLEAPDTATPNVIPLRRPDRSA